MSDLKEKFFTYGKVPFSYKRGMASLQIYVNPDSDELRKFIPEGARGFISTTGDFYVEGYENDGEPSDQGTVIHCMLLDLLEDSGLDIPKGYHDTFHNDMGFDYGITVERVDDNVFEVGESVGTDDADKEAALRLFALAKEKNPKLDFQWVDQSYTDSETERSLELQESLSKFHEATISQVGQLVDNPKMLDAYASDLSKMGPTKITDENKVDISSSFSSPAELLASLYNDGYLKKDPRISSLFSSRINTLLLKGQSKGITTVQVCQNLLDSYDKASGGKSSLTKALEYLLSGKVPEKKLDVQADTSAELSRQGVFNRVAPAQYRV